MINTEFLSTHTESREKGFDHIFQVDDDNQHSTSTTRKIRTGNFLKGINRQVRGAAPWDHRTYLLDILLILYCRLKRSFENYVSL